MPSVYSKKLKKNKHVALFFVIVCTFIIFVLFKFGNYIVLSSNPEDHESILTSLKDKLEIETSNIKPSTASWIENSNSLKILTGPEFTGLKKLETGENREIRETVNAYFGKKGFVKNPQNTFSTLDDNNQSFQVQSQGFTKGDLKCLVTVFLNSEPSSYYFCGVLDVKKNKLQDEFMPVLYGPSTQFPLQKNEAAVINVSKINNKYATGYNNRYMNGVYEPSGTTWIAAKVNGVWKLVFDSQDYPKCSAVDQYSVPREYYTNCYVPPSETLRFR